MEAIAPQSQPANACDWLQLWRKRAITIALVLLTHGVIPLLVKDLEKAARQKNIYRRLGRHTFAGQLIEDGGCVSCHEVDTPSVGVGV
jgi:mono/diheme cytochrome c family protein